MAYIANKNNKKETKCDGHHSFGQAAIIACTRKRSGSGALFKAQEGGLTMRKHITFAFAALVFTFSLIFFAAFTADQTTASNTYRVKAGTPHAVPVDTFLGVRRLQEVW